MPPEKLRIGLASARAAMTREEGLATVGRFLADAATAAFLRAGNRPVPP